MNPIDLVAWLRMGCPKAGAMEFETGGEYSFEAGTEVACRLRSEFGHLTRLAAIDLGAGPGETRIAQQILEIPWRRLVSVEAFGPYVEQLREKKSEAARREIVQGRIESIFELFRPGELDLALLIDVLEHLPRAGALRLLRRLESHVNEGIVIFLPVGYVEQEPFDENELQRHRSFWRAEDLARLGYSVTVYGKLHGQLDPPADAAWAIKKLKSPIKVLVEDGDAVPGKAVFEAESP